MSDTNSDDLIPTFRKIGGAASNMAKSAKEMASNPGNTARKIGSYDVGKPMGATARFAGNSVAYFNKGGLIWVWLSVALYFLDWSWLGFNGIDFTKLINSFKADSFWWFTAEINTGVLAIMILAYIVFWKHDSINEIVTYILAIILTYIIVTMVQWSIPSVFHLVFAWSMMYGLFYNVMPKENAHKVLIGVLFIDFFAFSFFAYFFNILWFTRLLIPIYFLMTLSYTKPHWIKNVLIFVVILFYLLQVVSTSIDYRDLTAEITAGQKVTAKKSVSRAWKNLKAIYNNSVTSIKQEIDDTKKDLSGDTYVSEVDANSKRDLGVSLEKVEASANTYIVGEKVVVYGNLKGRSMDSDTKVKVFITCDAKTSWYSGKEVKGVVDKVPVYEINMGLYEEKFFTCEFNNLTKGSWTVNVNAYFNFTSQGYLKSYFIDKDRYLSLRSKDIDVFEVFGITEKIPISKSVNGPGKIGIATIEPPTLITSNSNDDIFNSYVGVSLDSNWPGGRITKVNDIHITIPKGFSLLNCEGRFKDTPLLDEVTNEPIYSLTEEYIKKLQARKTITTVSEKCGLQLDSASEVLGDAPFTTKYFKANVDYEYLLKKSVTIMVNPPEKATLTPTMKTLNETYIKENKEYNAKKEEYDKARTADSPKYPDRYDEINNYLAIVEAKVAELKSLAKKTNPDEEDIKTMNVISADIDKAYLEINKIYELIEIEKTKDASEQDCDSYEGEGYASCEDETECRYGGADVNSLYTCPTGTVCCIS